MENKIQPKMLVDLCNSILLSLDGIKNNNNDKYTEGIGGIMGIKQFISDFLVNI